jgi:uncharacterized coiled-coil DUF342 family protein
MVGQVTTLLTGLLVGAIATFFGRLGLVSWKNRKKRTRLRKALLEEVVTMSESIDEMATLLKPMRPGGEAIQIPTDMLLTTVYQNNVGQLGMLTDEEVKQVTKFYSKCEVVRRLLDDLSEKDEIRPGAVDLLRQKVMELQGQMVEVRQTLSDELDRELDTRYRRVDLLDIDDDLPVRERTVIEGYNDDGSDR